MSLKPADPGQETRAAKLSDGTAALGEGTTAAPAASAVSVANLLTRHVLRDGEVILLILKPSRWYILLSSLLFIGGIAAILCALQLFQAPRMPMRYNIDAALFIVSCWMMWSVLNWMGRLYVLTDQRILRISGVLNSEIADCPLRKVATTRLVRSFGERLLGLGSIEIHPCDEKRTGSAWQTIRRPRQVHEKIEAAIRKAKQGL